MFLPDEIINLILSYREINPTTKLIKESVLKYDDFSSEYKLGCFYLSHLLNYKCLFYLRKQCGIINRYEDFFIQLHTKNKGNDVSKYDDDDEDKKTFYKYKEEINNPYFLYCRFYDDLRNSFRRCGMIDETHFFYKNILNLDYSLFFNKYRNEIFN
jgi:hypothetical protein